MSWADHIKNMMGKNCFSNVAICGNKGGVWAASSGFSVQEDEIASFARRVTGSASGDEATSKIKVAGKPYIFLRNTDGGMLGKDGKCGCVIASGKTCILVATYGEAHTAEQANSNLLAYGEYLKRLNV